MDKEKRLQNKANAKRVRIKNSGGVGAAAPQKQDVDEEKGWRPEGLLKNIVKKSEGVGGRTIPQQQDVQEEKRLEKKKV